MKSSRSEALSLLSGWWESKILITVSMKGPIEYSGFVGYLDSVERNGFVVEGSFMTVIFALPETAEFERPDRNGVHDVVDPMGFGASLRFAIEGVSITLTS